MRYQVVVEDTYQNGFAQALIKTNDGPSTEIRVDTNVLRNKICEFRPIAEDFLLIAATVYSLDKAVLRGQTDDNWTREIRVTIPVRESGQWALVGERLNQCVGFLTGDRWYFSFSPRSIPLIVKHPPKRNSPVTAIKANAVCLFSGGLDSLVGAIDWLAEHAAERLLLVGHHDGKVPGTRKDQHDVLNKLLPFYKDRLDAAFIGVSQNPPGRETTFRSRSLLFLALGLLFASALGDDIPLLIPENGAIALNAPLSPSRRGTCSTRTAHPHFLNGIREILNSVDLKNRIENPHESKSKGEVLRFCKNQTVLTQALSVSVSCAKRNRRGNPDQNGSWVNRQARNCGRCMPCIYRRAALHAINADHEVYGLDICKGDVDIDDTYESANDLKAFLYFLKTKTSESGLVNLLLATSSLDCRALKYYANIVRRALDEVRKLLKDKATVKIKQAAGLA